MRNEPTREALRSASSRPAVAALMSVVTHLVVLLVAALLLLPQEPLVGPLTLSASVDDGAGFDAEALLELETLEFPELDAAVFEPETPPELAAPELLTTELASLEPFTPPLGGDGPTAAESQSAGAGAGAADDILRRVSAAGGGDGVVRFSLAWETTDDLDLHIKTPLGERISYRRRRSGTGELDVDMNAGRRQSSEPVENVRFTGAPPRGKYEVTVHLYRKRSAGKTTRFRLQIKRGDKVSVARGVVSWQRRRWSKTYGYRG